MTGHHQGPSAANMSIIGEPSALLDTAIRKMILSGVSTALAAGNNSMDACRLSPARVAEAITTGATDDSDRATNSSNYGDCVALYAPGMSILSAGIAGPDASRILNGASMASPHVAGVAALYLQKYPGAPASEVREFLVNSSTDNVVITNRPGPRKLLYIQR